MKKSYYERFNGLHLANEHKEEIFMSVLDYNEKRSRRFLKCKYIHVVLIVMLLLGISVLMKTDVFDIASNHSYIIQANDDSYKITEDTIQIMDYKQTVSSYLSGIDSHGTITSYPFNSLLSVYIQGDNIRSITYSIDNARFYKIEEGKKVETAPGYYSPDCMGCFSAKKEPNTFPKFIKEGNVLPGDNEKPYWWFADKVNFNQITINYEDQVTPRGFYGISFEVIDKELAKTTNRDASDFYEEAEKRLVQAINNTKLDVRINFDDGTYEVRKLQFYVDANNSTQLAK